MIKRLFAFSEMDIQKLVCETLWTPAIQWAVVTDNALFSLTVHHFMHLNLAVSIASKKVLNHFINGVAFFKEYFSFS